MRPVIDERKLILASECLKDLESARTKLAALEMNHEVNILKAIKESVIRRIEEDACRRSSELIVVD